MSASQQNNNRILVTGAAGQLGIELTTRLRKKVGADNVIATDIRKPEYAVGLPDGPFEFLDVLDRSALFSLAEGYRIGTIYHLSAILSARGEKQIEATWRLNINGLLNVLELGRTEPGMRIFWPSSIAVFGPDAPAHRTPQNTPLNPTTVYGISKVAGEHWCAYYHRRYGVDVRSLRYPGLIGWRSEPGGGTTDYAVDMLKRAASGSEFECPVDRETPLPMMYMDDAVNAALRLMAAEAGQIGIRTSYNITAMSFTPGDLEEAIQKHRRRFRVRYAPDERDSIARSWPDSVDDRAAREDWSWHPEFDLDATVTTFFLSNSEYRFSPEKV
ncbi:NAD-dependent epimerase/dehydratase family protein [Balneolales bacterium ANBcel1]|nr:NAD-dependent epimerase/dehydratase family protein [Balneolales bacterium ANBcel1]